MVDPKLVLVAVAIAACVWLADEVTVGLKKARDVERKVVATIGRVVKHVVGKERE